MKKLKEFVKEHKKEIAGEALRVGYYAGGCVLGYVVGSMLNTYKIECGLQKMIAKNPQLETMMLDTLEEMGKS